jgi:co-chaperonin GroES (HSP10)
VEGKMLELYGNRVGIIPLYDPDMTPGGLYIPEANKGRSKQGVVKFLGSKCKFVKVGDHVIFSPYSGTTLNIDKDILIIIPEENIDAIVDSPVGALEVEGLYFKDKNKSYFKATYEVAMELCVRTLNDNMKYSRKTMDDIDYRPKVESYNK